MKIEIKSRWDEKKIILCGEYESVKDCLERNRGANLRGAHLEGANLEGANLRDAYLRDAYLRDAYLRDAYLRGAHLEDADLRGAYLEDANLRDAYLEGANLRGAYLEDANLRGAYLEGANLEGDKKIISNNVLSFSGFGSENRTTIAFKTDKGIWIQCGCYKGFINEFRDKIKETHKKTQYAKEYLRMCELTELRYGGK